MVADPKVERLGRQLVDEQDLRLVDPCDHDRQRHAVGDRAQPVLALLERVGRGALRGDVAGQEDAAAAFDGALAHAHPAAVGDAELLLVRRRAVLSQTPPGEILAHVGMIDGARRDRRLDDLREAHADLQRLAERPRRMLWIAAVVIDEAILGIEDGKAVHEGLGGHDEPLVAGARGPLGGLRRFLGAPQLCGALGDPGLDRRLDALCLAEVLHAADQPRARIVGYLLGRLAQMQEGAGGILHAVLDLVTPATPACLCQGGAVALAVVGMDPLEVRIAADQRHAVLDGKAMQAG